MSIGGVLQGHMNRDHADQTKEIAERSLGVEVNPAIYPNRFFLFRKFKRKLNVGEQHWFPVVK